MESAINWDLVNQIETAINFPFLFTTLNPEQQQSCNNLNELVRERRVIAKCIKHNIGEDQIHAIEDFKNYNDKINKLFGL